MSRRLLLIPGSLAVAAILAGCGAAGASSSPPSTTGASTAPTMTGQAEPATAPAATGLGSFDQRLLAQASSSGPIAGIVTPNGRDKPLRVSIAGLAASVDPSSAASRTGTPAAASPSGAASSSSAAPAAGSSAPSAGQTVTVTRTITVPGPSVLKTVAPNVPIGAWLPSTRPALSLTSFMVTGGNIGCVLSLDSARCDIAHRVWTTPRVPASCHLAWAQGLVVTGDESASFVCAADSDLNPSQNIVPAGDDDHLGSVTCQVRRIGVTCFTQAGHGFFISRTGYTTF